MDVYQFPAPRAGGGAAGEFVPVLEPLQQQGKIRHFGVAVDSAEDAIGFERHPAIETVQLPFSAVDRDAARAVFAAAVRTGAAVIARSCFAAGYLVGAHPEAELRALTADWEAIVEARATAAQLGKPLEE